MDAIEKLYQALEAADYVLIGAGAGLSAAAGLSFADEKAFRRDYPSLWESGVHSDYQTFSYKGWKSGQRWGYLARHIKTMLIDMPPLPLYVDLKTLLEGKNYHIITSNVDHQFIKAGFLVARVFEAQGIYGPLLCSASCSDDEYAIEPWVQSALPFVDGDVCLDEAHWPHCPRCGAEMTLAFRDTFGYDDHLARYRSFLKESEGGKTCIIEFGVGFNSAGVIRVPFERIVGERDRDKVSFFRVTVDYPDSEDEIAYPEIPVPIEDKSTSINRDAAEVIGELLRLKG